MKPALRIKEIERITLRVPFTPRVQRMIYHTLINFSKKKKNLEIQTMKVSRFIFYGLFLII